MKQLFIVDALNYLFRSYYAIRRMTNKEGISTNALFGFIRSVEKIRKDFDAKHLICVFDGPNNKESRTAIFPDYKGHREDMPEDLGPQIAMAHDYCKASGTPMIEVDGVEADDTMGSIAVWAAKEMGAKVYLCSSDKDLCQLVTSKIHILQTHKNNLIIEGKGVEEKFGIKPSQMIDYLAIVGDSSDNIPGIPGFGPKTAVDLLSEFGNLEKLIKNADKLKNPKRAEKVKTYTDDALMSYDLATIQLDVKFPKKESFFAVEAPAFESLVRLYEEMNFNTMLKNLDVPIEAHKKKQATESKSTSYEIVDTLEGVKKLLKKLEKEEELCIDTETTSLVPMDAMLLGIGLGYKEGEAYYIPFNGEMEEEALFKELKPLLTDPGKIFVGHNLKYDMHVLLNHGIELAGGLFDTMIASHLLNSDSNRHGLDDLVFQNFGHKMISIMELTGAKTKKDISLVEVPIEKVGPYCCEDVDFTFRLKQRFEEAMEAEELLNVFNDIEMPLLPVLLWMERKGVYLDVDYMEGLSKEFTKKIGALEKSIQKDAGEEFNIKSPKQLSHILFEVLNIKKMTKKTQTGYSTNAEVLEALREEHRIIPKIIEFRALEKLRSTYIDALPKQIDPQTHRIHCSFNQVGASTGRLSSTNPNLQNIPIRTEEGRKVRHGFIPEKKGWRFLSCDYSQIELRILAHMSGDQTMKEAFKHGEDIHRYTAAEVFKKTLKEVTLEMRSKAKAVNFGLIYGQGAYGLSKELGIPVREASSFIDAYFERYPTVHSFLEECKLAAKEEGRSVTLFGRERKLPEIQNKNAMIRNQAMRMAVNAPIQGTQADIIKIAMVEVDQMLFADKFETGMILQVHDELIFECPSSEIEEVKEKITHIMESVVELDVPLKVDNSVGKNWGEC